MLYGKDLLMNQDREAMDLSFAYGNPQTRDISAHSAKIQRLHNTSCNILPPPKGAPNSVSSLDPSLNLPADAYFQQQQQLYGLISDSPLWRAL
jgi:hypothetical protein